MKVFATIMNIQNAHLTKDVGLIPYGMSRYYGYKSYCINYNNAPYPSLANVPGLNILFVKKITGAFYVDAIFFLIKKARKIDVLNVYHPRGWSALYIIIYKFLNKSGKVYWKLDGCSSDFEKEENRFKRKLYLAAQHKCDVISTEIAYDAKMQGKIGGNKILYIPNPYDPNLEKGFRPFKERESTVLTVGRLGSEQKATDILMEAFRLALPTFSKDWKLRLVGPIETGETDFQKYIDKWYAMYPEMRGRVEFTGEILEREKLSEEYQKAKIFAFPSRHEGFSLAMIEAGVAGNYIIGTDIPSIREFTCEFEYGESIKVDDIDGLAAKLSKCCNTPDCYLEEKAQKLYTRVVQNYSLKSCCDKIQESLTQ